MTNDVAHSVHHCVQEPFLVEWVDWSTTREHLDTMLERCMTHTEYAANEHLLLPLLVSRLHYEVTIHRYLSPNSGHALNGA